MQTDTVRGPSCLRAGMVGLGMIFDETYRPLFEQLHAEGLFRRDFGYVDVPLVAVASRTGARAERYARASVGKVAQFVRCTGPECVDQLLAENVDAVCIATPDDRHFDAAHQALEAGKHVLIEKPSVLRLQELDRLAEIGAAMNTRQEPFDDVTSAHLQMRDPPDRVRMQKSFGIGRHWSVRLLSWG